MDDDDIKKGLEDFKKKFTYTDETNMLILDKFKKEITQGAVATYAMVQSKMEQGEITEDEFVKILAAAMGGMFIVAFKMGNNFLFEEINEEKK